MKEVLSDLLPNNMGRPPLFDLDNLCVQVLSFNLSFFIITELARNPPDGVSVGLGDDENIFCWELMIIGPPDTLYEGGFFAAKLVFPSDFPNQPPVMTFKTPLWHPNGESKN